MIIRRLVLTFLLCTLLGLGAWAVFSDKEEVILVETAPVNVQTLFSTLTVNGSIVDTGSVSIAVPQAARIEKLYVSEGSEVVKGQVIARAIEVLGTLNLQWPAMSEELQDSISYVGMDEEDLTSMLTQYIYSVFSGTDGDIFYLISPCDGIVTGLAISEGDYVTANYKAAEISDFSDLEVSAFVSERNIADLVEGLRVDLTGDAFVGKYNGVLTKIMPTAVDTGTLTSAGETVVEVRIKIKKPDADLKPGYSAKAVIYTVRKTNALLVPYEAVIQDDTGAESVYVLKDGIAVKRKVETGRELADFTEIITGLSESDCVILNPVPEILSGAAVTAK